MSEQKEGTIRKEGKLRRNLTAFEATVFSVSFVIGTGIFLKPSSVLINTGSTAMAVLFWVLGGVITLCSALSIAEIAAYIPKLGGTYTYLTELYGERLGFMQGWVSMLIGSPAGCAGSAIAFATFASYFVPLSNAGLKILSIGTVLFFAAIQMISTKASMKLQVVGTFGKLIPIFAILFYGLFKGEIPGAINFSLVEGTVKGGYGLALLGVLWAYDGWVATCQLGSELVEPEKNLPKSIFLSLTFVTVVYALFNIVIFKTIPAAEVVASQGSSIGVEAAKILFGSVGTSLVSIGMLISSAVTLNAQILNAARTTLAVGKRKQTIGANVLGHVNAKYDTPINALIFVIILACTYILSGSFDSVTNLTIFVVWVFFVFTVYGVFILRKKYPRNEKLYHVPFYPVIPIIGILGGCYLIISTLFSDPLTAFIGIGVSVIGFPMYYYCKKKYSNDSEIK